MPKQTQMLPVADFHSGGVIFDSDPFSLQINEWSDARNVRFDNRSVSKISGEERMLTLTNTPVEGIYWERPTDQRYVYVDSTGRVWLKAPSGAETEITKGVGANTRDLLDPSSSIQLSLFNGGATLIVNDGTQTPQYIHHNGQELADLPNWLASRPGFTSITAGVVRTFGNAIIAGDITYTNASNEVISAPSTLRISNIVGREPGVAYIPTWDAVYSGATTADEFDLATNTAIIEMMQFQNAMAIYTANGIFLLRQTGSTSIPWAVSPASQGRGMLTDNCGVEFYGRHFIVGNEDIYLNGGGAQVVSASDGRVRDYFFENINRAQIGLTHVQHNQRQDEIWINYPKGTSTTCNEALIWNYTHNTWTVRDLNGVVSSTYGGRISGSTFATSDSYVQMFTADGILTADRGNTFNGTPIVAYVERRGFDIAPTAVNVSKWVGSIYLLATGTGSLEVNLKPSNTPGMNVNFDDRADDFLSMNTFTLSGSMQDYKVDPNENGRYINIRFRSEGNDDDWTLIRYNIAYTTDDET